MKRKTSQFLLPIEKPNHDKKSYDIYPAFHVKDGSINVGYKTLADKICNEKVIILDGYIGLDWEEISSSLKLSLEDRGLRVIILNISNYLKSEKDISDLVNPFLGGEDPVFGYRADIELNDFFDNMKIDSLKLEESTNTILIYGTGASQLNFDGFLVYFDLPKNELQYRMRANEVANLGFTKGKNPKQMYKHFYFVDWIVLNKEKKKLLPKIDIIVDKQRSRNLCWMTGELLRQELNNMSKKYFRVRPWFESGVWGGQWIREKIHDLSQDVPNYAWSFEMIVPENGLLFESEGKLLEVSFDMLMFQEQENILGKAAKRFGDEFPIRFDFLDTFQGGNLSVQCHPKPDYIKKEFGENFTQDETYYILDAEDDAEVYLGFQNDIDETKFKKALEHSYETKETLDVESYVQKLPAKKHDLFLIPHGTIHCSGTNNMVLEISATPYIFTFKMYDWLRMDLDGNPRPMNIDRAFENLNFERKGQNVQDTLISKPIVENSGDDWKKIHLPTHPDHFYDVYRYEFEDKIHIDTKQQCHVLMLVEGETIELNVNEDKRTFHYAETFAIPAAAKNYTLINTGNKQAKVIVSFVKENAC
ncbi:class I mannose-6-phosphate isomerase [Flavivirga spongiicola]|uniref:Class I mannose-6-phosphate isomerase n=1 Tax=Flavivirga spongiicola TaxID=421621 RepID=A0ABU7XR38_9FLAO|nr:class I mannose-6-phosphate isomerase [Flavivirga sp. MEBiC05379]MDO5978247.1 class I mannose-6-phosphate isomerase [Flavivirga sp. MEBiC05379]